MTNIIQEVKANTKRMDYLDEQLQIIINKLEIIQVLFENIDEMMKMQQILKETINQMNGYDHESKREYSK